jgi:signal transduction histidine kinase
MSFKRRIILAAAPAWYDWLTANRAVRYGVAGGAAACGVGLSIALEWAMPGSSSGTGIRHILLFGAVALSAVVGGLYPGLAATAAVVASAAMLRLSLPPGESRLLAVEGILVSVIGGTLRAARIKADERLRDNLALEQQILEIGDDERRRIGHDLHDGLGQHLTGISLLSETLSQRLDSGKLPDAQTVETITRLVSEAVGITRDLAKSLSPVTLERDGLVAAIEELAETSSGLLGINCRGEFLDQDLNLDRARSLHLYRIAQEAVSNSVRHGKAKHVTIAVRRQDGMLHLTVTDDGAGLSEKTIANPGLGLRIMQYRSRMLGATLAVERAGASGGTVVTCICPLEPAPRP